MTKSVNPDSATSDQDLHCSLRSVCPNTLGKYSRSKNHELSCVKCEFHIFEMGAVEY